MTIQDLDTQLSDAKLKYSQRTQQCLSRCDLDSSTTQVLDDLSRYMFELFDSFKSSIVDDLQDK